MIPKYKDIIDLIKKGSTLEAQEKILELREVAVALQDGNHALRERIKKLEEELKLRSILAWEKPYYWLMDGERRDGPYCQLCYDKQHSLIRLQGGGTGKWYCHSCKSFFYDSTYKPVEPKHRSAGKGNWVIR